VKAPRPNCESAFGAFDVDVESTRCRLAWQTASTADLCRVLLSSDATLKGVERVLDSNPGVPPLPRHWIELTDLKPSTNYHVLVLAFSATGNGGPVQSPIIAFRTPAR
jgi:hypothetical protein